MLDHIKRHVRPAFHKVRFLTHRLRNIAPHLPISPHSERLVRMGSEYGGWTLADLPGLRRSLVISCGLGEDASFDIELASRYGARVLIVDPTPRAIAHFQAIEARTGLPRQLPYSHTGAQPPQAYDLSSIEPGQLALCDKALWNDNTTLRFFKPTDPAHVSHSIINFQNNYATDSDHIEVQAITVDRLVSEFEIQHIELLKLDIEGAEVEVLVDMMAKGIYPSQILVEYDELSFPSKRSKERVESAHAALVCAGYELICRVHTNFTYVRRT